MSGQTGRIVGTIVGAALAYFTAGTSYVALGATLGGAVGSLLDPKQKIEGPRLDDLKVQVSTYSIGIPTLDGTERFGGNVIWSTDKLEVANTESQGKGGGGVENTTYKYYVHMRQLLMETPRDGSEVSIVKIVQDGKLIWDASSGIPVASALASAENLFAGFILYQGHQDQLPNPEEEAWEGGPGSVSAYRGIVSIYMRAIECPGGRVPQFSFVLSTSAGSTADASVGTEFELTGAVRYSYSQVPTTGDPAVIFAERSFDAAGGAVDQKVVDVYALGFDYCTLISTYIPGDYSYQYTALEGASDIDAVCFRGVTASTNSDTGSNLVLSSDGSLRRFVVGTLAYGESNSCWAKGGNRFAICGDDSHASTTAILFDWESALELGRDETVSPSGMWIGDYVWVKLTISGVPTLQARNRDDFTIIASAALPSDLQGTGLNGASFCADGLVLRAYSRKSDPETSIWEIGVDGSDLSFEQDGIADVPVSSPTTGSIAVGMNEVTVVGVSGGAPTDMYRMFAVSYKRAIPSPIKAKEIIARQCERAGETRYDVSALPDSDTVYGYKIAGPASARANIEPILTCFGYFIVDEDGVIKVKRYADITSIASVAFDELGQAEDGGNPSDAMPLNRTQEVDLPRSVTVSYIDPTNDFQTATETEERQITEATEDTQIQLPVCVSSDQAKKVAQMALYDQHRRQNQRSLTVSRKFSAISPGDGVTIEYPRGTFKLWLVLSTNDTGAVCEWSVVPGDAAIFTQVAIGASDYIGQQVTPLPPPVRMVIGDWPLLRDADNNPGIYTAFGALGAGARGATLWVGDDDNSLQERGSVFSFVSIGVAQGALGDWPVNIVDQSNTMIVNAAADAFISVSIDAMIASGTLNACAFGAPGRWEILQFATASYLGGNQWLIYDFIRGQRGTEHNRGNHEQGDVLVLLAPAGILRPNMDTGALNQSKQYRAISLGRSLSSAPSQSYSNTGEGLRPFSPVNLLHELVGGDIVFTWNRRTRLSTNWMAGVVPLGEESEAYTLTLYTDGTFSTVKRVFATSAPTTTYTAAQMAADSYTPGQPLYSRVRQISGSVGAGHELEATL